MYRCTSVFSVLAILITLLDAAPGLAQVSVYLGGDGNTTVQRGREFCGTDPINLNVEDGVNFSVSSASKEALKGLPIIGTVPSPMGSDTTLATSPIFGVSLVNPSEAPLTVSEVQIEGTGGRLFNTVLGLQPATGWSRRDSWTIHWVGTVVIEPNTAFDFMARGQPDNQDRVGEQIIFTAFTDAGTYQSTSTHITSQTRNNATPAVSMYFMEAGLPALSGVEANFGEVRVGLVKTFTLQIEESEDGNSQAIPAGTELTIVVPPGWADLTMGASGTFTQTSLVSPTDCTDGVLVATTNAAILGGTGSMQFSARAPLGLRSTAMFPITARLNNTTISPPINVLTEYTSQVIAPTIPGAIAGISVPTAYAITPHPMGDRNAGVFGASFANPTDNPMTIREVIIQEPPPGLGLFRDIFPIEPATGWSLVNNSEIHWTGQVTVAPHDAIDFMTMVQANSLDSAGPIPIAVSIVESTMTYVDAASTTVEGRKPFASLYFWAEGRPSAYVPGVLNGTTRKFTVVMKETEGGKIPDKTLLTIEIPARWANVTAEAGQLDLGDAFIVQPTPTSAGSIEVTTTRRIRRGERRFTFSADAPSTVWQSLFSFPATLTSADGVIGATAQAIVQTAELDAGNIVIRHNSPPVTDSILTQIDVELVATSNPREQYIVQIMNNTTQTWETLAATKFDGTSRGIVKSVRNKVGQYRDIGQIVQTRVLATAVRAHDLHEDMLRFIVSQYHLDASTIAPLTAVVGTLGVPLERMLLHSDEGIVTIREITMLGTGNDPANDVAALHLVADTNCDGQAQQAEPILNTTTVDPARLAVFDLSTAPISASVGTDVCILVTADVAAGGTLGNLIGVRIVDGNQFTTDLGDVPMPSVSGYPINSELVLLLDTDLDLDGIEDADEINECHDEADQDSDDDGLTDLEELLLGTDPCLADSDLDGLPDGLEEGVPELASTFDSDGDGTPDLHDPDPNAGAVEGTNINFFRPDLDPSTLTNSLDDDTDDDGLLDGSEDTNIDGRADFTIGGTGTQGSGETDATGLDTDGDGCQDGTESGIFLPQGIHTDWAIFQPDFFPTSQTSPLDTDSDEDGLDDGVEDANCNGEVDPGETDPTMPEGPDILRNDETTITDRQSPLFSSIFVGTGINSLDPQGMTPTPTVGEGPDPTLNGSDDTDDLYQRGKLSPWTDTDGDVVISAGRPLVFYQTTSTLPLFLTRSGPDIILDW